MPTFRHTLDIDAPCERVWEVLMDLERWPEWTASTTRVQRLDAQPFGMGTRARIEQPGLRPAEWVVTRCEPGRGFEWVSRNPGADAVALHELAARPGGCTLTLAVDYRGWLAPLVGALAGGMTRRYLAMEAEGLKRRSEGKG